MNITELVDHVELEHERELAPGETYTTIRKAHSDIHEKDRLAGRGILSHYHELGTTGFKERA